MKETMNFTDRLIQKIIEKQSHTVVGLDPRMEMIPDFIREESCAEFQDPFQAASEAILRFNREIIHSVVHIVPAVKPQIAFYERYGHWGVRAFAETADYAKDKGLIVIGDVKRNDIGSTSEAYADAYLGDELSPYNLDAITVNPYFGSDGVLPFIQRARDRGKGIFVLVKTSNKSSEELQDLKTDGRHIYEVVGEMVDRWGKSTEGNRGYKCVGGVVGATFPGQADDLRHIMPRSYLLVPGYGAQGATAADVISYFNPDGLGAVVNSSRGIIFAYKDESNLYGPREFGKAARAAALRMNQEINAALEKAQKRAW